MTALNWKLPLALAAALLAPHAQAQRMYRCGNEFSQSPCATDARTLDVQPASGYSRQYQSDMRRRTRQAQLPYQRVAGELKRRITSVDGAITRYRDALSSLASRPGSDGRGGPSQERIEREWAVQGMRIKGHLTQLEADKAQRVAELARLDELQVRRPNETVEDHVARLERDSARLTAQHNEDKARWMNVNLR